jgi:molybdopterin/thiamine biosynthesis adenylyltransferase
MVSKHLSSFEQDRFSRQITLPQIGQEGQLKIKNATVLVSRVGGVGGTVAAYLARAGIGKLILLHPGNVETEYLNRWQLAFTEDHLQPSAETFAKHIQRINPEVEVTAYNKSATDAAALPLFQQADIIADGAPIFEERYAMNHAAIQFNKPLVSGAMYGLEGYVLFVKPKQSACLRCVYPERPDYWKDRSVFPVIGPCPSMVGSMMAMEIIKHIIGFGDILTDKLWYFDLESNYFNTLQIARHNSCPDCGEHHV